MSSFRQKSLFVTGFGLCFLSASAMADPASSANFSQNQTVADSALDNQRGMFAPGVDIGELMSATTTGNTVYSSFTGTNNVDGNAFSNISGIVNVIQNLGSNVVIQNAVVVNLNLH